MADTRAKGIVATSFIGGLLLAAAISAPQAWEPVPEPFFGLDEPVEVAAPLPIKPAAVAAAPEATITLPTPVGNLSSMAAAMPAVVRPGPPPERLALADPPAPKATGRFEPLVAQAVPHRSEAATPRPEPDHSPKPTTLPTAKPLPLQTAKPDSLKSLVTRVQMHREPAQRRRDAPASSHATPDRIEAPKPTEPLGAAPLPGAAWTDPDSVNWTDSAEKRQPSTPSAHGDVHAPGGQRFMDRLRAGERLIQRGRRDDPLGGERLALAKDVPDVRAPGCTWPHPAKLLGDLRQLASVRDNAAPLLPCAAWSRTTLTLISSVLATAGPRDAAAAAALISLGDAVHEGMTVADQTIEPAASTQMRRASLAVSRRVAVWRAAAGMLAVASDPGADGAQADAVPLDPLVVACTEADVARLLETLERYELSQVAADADAVKGAIRTIEKSPLSGGAAVARAVHDHYLTPNVRIAVHSGFVEKLLPDQEVKTSPLEDVIAGRQVRGTRTVTRSTAVRFIPDADEIAMHLEVHGDVSSRSVTAAGPVSLTSRGTSSFVVRKPIKVSSQGLQIGPATGTASNSSQLAGIQTSFDSVPVMRSLVRQIARSQHDENLPDINREVIEKIVARACRETDEQAEPRFLEAAERIRTRIWTPLVTLGLDPTPVALETTPTIATLRLRLAADDQLAAHTPRPRAPTDAQLSMQLHDSAVNNAIERLGLAGRRFTLEELVLQCCERLGLEPKVPDDMPEGVEITFARSEPLRISCTDGLVRVRVALEALTSGRRAWYDVIAQVAYKPSASGAQVFLERDGPVQISGPGHQGRMEIALRTIFGKVFPKERPIAVLPERITKNPRLQNVQAVQAVSSDGWLALALAARESPATVAVPKPTSPEARRPTIFR